MKYHVLLVNVKLMYQYDMPRGNIINADCFDMDMRTFF